MNNEPFDTLYPPPVFTFRLFRLGDNYSDTGGEPEFVDLYRGLFGLYWPIIFGKACEEAGSELLIKKRNDIRFVLLIMGLLFIAAISLTGFSFEVKPRWVH